MRQGPTELLRALLSSGLAHPDHRDEAGCTALQRAAVAGQAGLPLAQLLLTYQADPDLPNNMGWTGEARGEGLAGGPGAAESLSMSRAWMQAEAAKGGQALGKHACSPASLCSSLHLPLRPAALHLATYSKQAAMVQLLLNLGG